MPLKTADNNIRYHHNSRELCQTCSWFKIWGAKKHITKRNTKSYITTVWNAKAHCTRGITIRNQNRRISKYEKAKQNATIATNTRQCVPLCGNTDQDSTEIPSPTAVEPPCLVGIPRCRILNSSTAPPTYVSTENSQTAHILTPVSQSTPS